MNVQMTTTDLSHALALTDDAALRQVMAIAQGILAGRRTPRATTGGLAPWQMRKLLEHVERNLDQPLANDDLAQLVGLSTAHFCAAFRQSFDSSPHAHIVRLRVERASAMMRETRHSLSQIALSCGFSDQSHFSRLFRRQMHDTPAAWRKRHADNCEI